MELYDEVKKIVEFRNSCLNIHERKTEAALTTIADKIVDDYNRRLYDFKRLHKLVLKKDGKRRSVKLYEPFASEEVLCIYIKRFLDKRVHIKYPNRNEYVHSLFDILNALKTMNDYTIFRFDFEDYFNSVSSEYVFKKIIVNCSLEREQLELLECFVESTGYAYAGLNTSNLICEIIAKQFDERLLIKLKDKGVIFYRRYIDDGITIFNKYISKDDCLSIIENCICDIFYDVEVECKYKCKTSLNLTKTHHISVRDMLSGVSGISGDEFDFLGYLFVLSVNRTNRVTNTTFKYGITQKKIIKYEKKIERLVKEFKTNHDIVLFRHRIKAFTCRAVYRVARYKSLIWKTKGFISNYCELRYRMDHLTDDTKRFLQNAITDGIANNSLNIPYFMKGNTEESSFSLYNNLLKNKTLLLVDNIGISKSKLIQMCKEVGVNTNKEYDSLVREYLIKVKVGH